MNQKSLDKKKPKELDWEEDFCRQVRFYCGGDLDYKTELKPLVKTVYSLLQKQRTELLEEIKEIVKEHLADGNFENFDVLHELKKEVNSLEKK